ncbi:hypothetical protein JX266_014174 [Neoarthrinium moseri]|nr:hypothetical protein JX266_014174 [Neoarthrinium moseri]
MLDLKCPFAFRSLARGTDIGRLRYVVSRWGNGTVSILAIAHRPRSGLPGDAPHIGIKGRFDPTVKVESGLRVAFRLKFDSNFKANRSAESAMYSGSIPPLFIIQQVVNFLSVGVPDIKHMSQPDFRLQFREMAGEGWDTQI